MISKKESILRAAQELFAQNGYAGTTMKTIATEADVAAGLVFHYFDNKEQLFMAAGEDLIHSLVVVLQEQMKDAQNGRHALQIFVKAYLQFTIENEKTFPTIIRCSPFSDDNPDLDRQAIGAKFRQLIDLVEVILRRGIDDGSLRDLPVTETAFMIYASIVGAVRTRFLTPYDVPELYDEACDFVMRSVCTPQVGKS